MWYPGCPSCFLERFRAYKKTVEGSAFRNFSLRSSFLYTPSLESTPQTFEFIVYSADFFFFLQHTFVPNLLNFYSFTTELQKNDNTKGKANYKRGEPIGNTS